MKREVLREQRHEDGSYTRVEKVTQTPEDGFVSNRVHTGLPLDSDGGMFGHGSFKGHRTTIFYQNTNPKVVRPVFFVVYTLVALLVIGIFAALISAQENPAAAKAYTSYLIGAIVFFGLGLVIAIAEFRDQDKLQKKYAKEKKTLKK